MVLHTSFVCRLVGVYPDQPEAGLCRYQGGAEPAPATTVRPVNIQMGWRVDQARPASLLGCWRGCQRGRGCELGRTLQFEVRPMKFVEYSALAHNTRQSPASGRGCWRLQCWPASSSLQPPQQARLGGGGYAGMLGYATMPLCITCKIRRRGPPELRPPPGPSLPRLIPASTGCHSAHSAHFHQQFANTRYSHDADK